MSKHNLNIIILILNVGISMILFNETDLIFICLLLSFVIFLSHTIVGITIPKYNYFTKSIFETSNNKILLTFDDGPCPINTPKILDTLKKHNVKAIFFVIGEKAELNKELLERIINEGHFLGNHTYTHSYYFALISKSNVIIEIEKCNQILNSYIKKMKYFRPPIGILNPIIVRYLKKEKYVIMAWTFRSLDTIIKNPNRLKKRLLNKSKAGNIILLHDNLNQTQLMLNAYLKEAKLKGLNFVDILN